MNLPKIAHYATRPDVIQSRGDGSFLYNYNIQSEMISDRPGEAERESFICSQVIVFESPTKKAVKKAVIENEFPGDEEKKLINDFNAFNSGSLVDVKYRDNYLDFLERRKAIKEMIDNELLIFEV